MRESRTYGSVRGALSNERPYRDRIASCALSTITLRAFAHHRRGTMLHGVGTKLRGGQRRGGDRVGGEGRGRAFAHPTTPAGKYQLPLTNFVAAGRHLLVIYRS